MSSQRLDDLTKLVTKASQSLADTQQLLTNLVNESEVEIEMASPEEEARCLQLILEYRLSNQDALVSLLNLDKHLLYILGIQPQHSAQTNLERLTYALGGDDLKQILHALSQLVEHLLRIAQRYQTQQKKYLNNKQKSERIVKIINGMQTIALKQLIFLDSIHALEKNIVQLLKFEAIGPIHDHIAGLRGPISQFYQAILNGLQESQLLYQQVNKNQPVHLAFDLLLKKADDVLQQMPSLYQPQPHYSLGHFTPKTSQQLEERAATKRMRPFF